jgi:hypothetical protein
MLSAIVPENSSGSWSTMLMFPRRLASVTSRIGRPSTSIAPDWAS